MVLPTAAFAITGGAASRNFSFAGDLSINQKFYLKTAREDVKNAMKQLKRGTCQLCSRSG
jgi:hypothetical protein